MRFFRGKGDPSVHIAEGVELVEESWKSLDGRLLFVPGKQMFSKINIDLQKKFGVSVTPLQLATHMGVKEVPDDLKDILRAFEKLSQ